MLCKIFCCLVDEKIYFKVLACSFEITYLFENPNSNHFNDPKAAIWNWNCLQEAAYGSVKSYWKPPMKS